MPEMETWETSFTLDGIPCRSADIAGQCRQYEDEQGFPGDIWRFLAQWFDNEDFVPGETSGSTGTPKSIRLEKKRMRESARMTCSFLGLEPGTSAFLCMPLRYIGAKMIVVRAITAHLNLVWATPSSHPLKSCTAAPHFAAMTPMQVIATLESPEEARLLREVRHLIIGGGPVDAALAAQLRDFPFAVWSTYGMTETLSHIALRRLNGAEASEWYTPFDGVSLSISPDDTLAIDAPLLCPGKIVTNDRVTLRPDGRFRILGRRDNVINSGGIKIQIEKAEELLRPHLRQPFLITSAPDAHTGEQAVLLLEGAVPEAIAELCRAALPRYWAPKRIFQVGTLPRAGSDKPDRATARKLAEKLLSLSTSTQTEDSHVG